MDSKFVHLIALIVLGVGLVLHIVGLATPEWVTIDISGVKLISGLWEACGGGVCTSIAEDQKEDWLKACEAMAILVMLVGCVAVIVEGIFFGMEQMGKETPKSLPLIALSSSIISWSICYTQPRLTRIMSRLRQLPVYSSDTLLLLTMESKLVPLIALIVLGVGLVLHIVGLATPEWATVEAGGLKGTSGLWETCAGGVCVSIPEDLKSDWLKASEAMAILGMLVGCVAVIVQGIFFVMEQMGKETPKSFPLIALSSSIISFIFIIIGVIIYGAKAKEGSSSVDLGYSFGLSITGAILILIGGIFAFMGSR